MRNTFPHIFWPHLKGFFFLGVFLSGVVHFSLLLGSMLHQMTDWYILTKLSHRMSRVRVVRIAFFVNQGNSMKIRICIHPLLKGNVTLKDLQCKTNCCVKNQNVLKEINFFLTFNLPSQFSPHGPKSDSYKIPMLHECGV